MQIGTVFKWDNFPFQNDGKIKTRYFIFLGHSGWGICPVIFHAANATTQTGYYRVNGHRLTHKTMNFKQGEFGFEADCIVDFDWLESLSETTYQTHKSDIRELSVLDEKKLKEVWELIRTSGRSFIVKMDIYDSLHLAGFKGLPSPARKI